VKGIYRRSTATSKIELGHEFDEHLVPVFYEYHKPLQDIHSIASALKMYFCELSNFVCTYQLYHAFADAIQFSHEVGCRLLHMMHAVEKLPPPYYRTLRALLLHLAHVAKQCHKTGITSHNLAIVWASNTLQYKELKVSAVAPQPDIRAKVSVSEFLNCYTDEIVF
jgi:hypothetical protein